MFKHAPLAFGWPVLFAAAALVLTLPLGVSPAHAQVATPGSPTPTAAPPPAMVAPVAAPIAAPAAVSPKKYVVHVSLARLIAPMFQLKGDYVLNEHVFVGALAAIGSPAKDGLTSYDQHELGAHAGYFPVGTVRRGLGLVAQVRGYHSVGEQVGEGDDPSFTATGLGVSTSGFISARLQTSSSLVLQADAGLKFLYATGTADGDGGKSEASTKVMGRLLNFWVGFAF